MMRGQLLLNKQIFIGGSIVFLLILIAITSPLLTSFHPYSQNLIENLLPPGGSGHFLGTDEFGRDLWSRIVYGARISIKVAFTSVSIALLSGCFFGVISGYFGRGLDMFLGRLNDILMAFPPLLLALMIVAVLGSGFWLSDAIPAIVNGTMPESIKKFDIPVNVACVFDLAFMIPLMFIGAIELWKGKVNGLVLSMTMLSWLLLTCISVISMEFGLKTAGLDYDMGKIIAFGFEGVLSIMMIILVMRNMVIKEG